MLDGLTQTLFDPVLLLRPLQHREALRSSSLEGTYATPRELLLFELDPFEPTSATDQASAWQEVHNYARALELGTGSVEEGLSLVLVRQLHRELLRGVRGRDKSPGEFRDDQVYVGANHRFAPPPVTHLSACLEDLRDYMQAPRASVRVEDEVIAYDTTGGSPTKVAARRRTQPVQPSRARGSDPSAELP